MRVFKEIRSLSPLKYAKMGGGQNNLCFYHSRNFCIIKHMQKISGFRVIPPYIKHWKGITLFVKRFRRKGGGGNFSQYIFIYRFLFDFLIEVYKHRGLLRPNYTYNFAWTVLQLWLNNYSLFSWPIGRREESM